MKDNKRAKGLPARRPGARRARSPKPRSMGDTSPSRASSLSIQPQDVSLTRMLETLKPHDHLCLIYESPEEWRACVVPFISIGLKHGEKCGYIVDTSTAAEIRKYLAEEGVDVASAEKSGQLFILSETETYTKEGSFDPDRMIALLISETEKAIAEGYPALRVTGEMTWVLRGHPGSEKLLEYEAKLNRDFFPKYPCLAICQYDCWKFDPEIIKGVIMTHPLLVRGNHIYHNFYYIPLEGFLNQKRAGTEVQHWLNSIEREQRLIESLRQNEENCRRSLGESPLGIRIVSGKGKVLYANRAVLDIYGYDSIEELRATPTKERYTPESYAEHQIRKEKRLLGEYVPSEYEISIVRKNGEIRHLQVIRKEVPWNDKTQNQSIYQDITERREAEEALRQGESGYRTLIDSLPQKIFLKDKNSVYISCNENYARDLKIKPQEITGKTDYDFFPKEVAEKYERDDKKIVKSNRVDDFEEQYVQDGETRWVHRIKTPVTDEQGNVFGLLGIFWDITVRKRLEMEQQLLGKMEAVGTLAGGIAHDFNNILTVILGNISFARMEAEAGSELYDLLEEAEKASLRAKDLTQQLLTFSKGGAPIKAVASLSELLEETASFASRGSDVKCQFSIPDDLWHVEIDQGQISQVINNLVINNLVINAQQAMPAGGTIEVRAENMTLTNKQSLGKGLPVKTGKYTRIAVTDHGAGISEEHLNKIFDPFFTTKQKGSGLGLSTSFSIVRNHGGHLGVVSKLGSGSTFYVYLPAVKKKPPRKNEEKKKVRPVGKARILVMDDEETVRKSAGRMLKYLGCKDIEFAIDGSEAIKLYTQAMKAGKPFDVVILDLTIPGGMGGGEAIKKLLKIDPKVKSIVSSGYSSKSAIAEHKKHGFRSVLVKPYAMEQLSKALHDLI